MAKGNPHDLTASKSVPNEENIGVGDNETQEMKRLFEICYEEYSTQWIKRNEIKNLIIKDDSDLFGYYDFDKKGDQIKFGNKITKYIGRIFSDIKLVVDDVKIRGSRQQYKFIKSDENVDKQEKLSKKDNNLGRLGRLGQECNLSRKRNESSIRGVGRSTISTKSTKGGVKIKSIIETEKSNILPKLPKSDQLRIEFTDRDDKSLNFDEFCRRRESIDIINKKDEN